MFKPFPNLPTELRLKIWQHVPQPRRIIEIGQARCDPTRGFYFACATPALLHACRESRGIALGTYQLAFGSPPLTPPQEQRQQQQPVYVNFALDTFYLVDQEQRMLDAFVSCYGQARCGLESIRHLAVNSYVWDAHARYTMEQSHGMVMGVLASFAALEDFAVVLEPFCCWSEDPCSHGESTLSFVEPAADADVMRGWSFLCPTFAGVRELVEMGLDRQDEWGLEGGEASVGRKPVRILAAYRP